MRRSICCVLLFAAGVVLSLAPASAAPRQFGVERISSFNSDMTIRGDGSLDVIETIDYDFAGTEHHGIDRKIPTRFPYSGATPHKGTFERVTPVSDVSASSPTGAPSDVDVSEDDVGVVTIRIGDPDVTISGQQQYVINYRVEGVYNAFRDHDELYWNVTGDQWTVEIADVTATLRAPASITKAACFAGPQGSTLPCDKSSVDGSVATFAQASLSPGSGLTTVVGLPPGTVADASPILEELWSFKRAFRATFVTIGGGLLLLLAGVAGVITLVWRKGRDRRYTGSTVDAAFGNTTGQDTPVSLRDREQHPVEFVPPEGVRPGHMGTLWDEVANPLDVSAMIIDLAVRGYLRIDEVEPATSGVLGFGAHQADYNFVQLREPDESLLDAERILLQALFRDGQVARLSELKTHFAERLQLVEGALYDDSVRMGWFPTRPDRVRARWHVIGLAVLIAGGGIAFLLIRYTTLGLLALPLPLIGLMLLTLGGKFPSRTAKGTALLGRVKGFKELFDVGEGERQRFAESKHLFSQYLPYAIVFGMADRWAQTFQALGLSPQEMGVGTWYTSPYGYDPITFGYAMSSFSTVTTGSIAAATPSSSGGSGFGGGGFSGGGFGGGGGGSW